MFSSANTPRAVLPSKQLHKSDIIIIGINDVRKKRDTGVCDKVTIRLCLPNWLREISRKEGRIRQNDKPAYLLIKLISSFFLPSFSLVVSVTVVNSKVLDERETTSGSTKIKGEFLGLAFDYFFFCLWVAVIIAAPL